MRSVKFLVGTTAAIMISTAAAGADLPPPMPPMIYQPPTVVEQNASGWYLRGDIGMSNQRFSNLSHPDFVTAPQFTFLDKGGFDSAPIFGVGVGYQLNNWARFDVTGEFRGKASFHALDRFFNTGMNAFNTNMYTASKSEWVFLANAYIDLGTWWCITPFIGAGVGFTENRIDHFRDVNVIAGGGGWADTGTQTNLAWALHAGLAYKVTRNFTVELAYRYLNLGNGQTGILRNLDPTLVSGNPLAPMTFNSLSSHDIMLGVRWMLEPEPAPVVMPQAPLMRRG